MFSGKIGIKAKEMLSKAAVLIAKQAEEHAAIIQKVTYLLGVLGFGGFCFVLGARPQDMRYWYCLFYMVCFPTRWVYYRYRKWHYYLLDFCYYANTIVLIMLFFYPRNEKLFMVCFSLAEGPLAWATVVWRFSLVFSSMNKMVSVLIHLFPGVVLFTIRWWDPVLLDEVHTEGSSQRASWPSVDGKSHLWTWLFPVPLLAYCIWQLLYFLIVDVLRRQRFIEDPEIMTSYKELSKQAQKADNIWWRLSGLLGPENRLFMFIILQGIFTLATTALAVPIFLSYRLHLTFQVLKVSATIWHGAHFLVEVMPRHLTVKEKEK